MAIEAAKKSSRLWRIVEWVKEHDQGFGGISSGRSHWVSSISSFSSMTDRQQPRGRFISSVDCSKRAHRVKKKVHRMLPTLQYMQRWKTAPSTTGPESYGGSRQPWDSDSNNGSARSSTVERKEKAISDRETRRN